MNLSLIFEFLGGRGTRGDKVLRSGKWYTQSCVMENRSFARGRMYHLVILEWFREEEEEDDQRVSLRTQGGDPE